MKLTDNNINNILTDIDIVVKDVLLEGTELFDKIRFVNGVTLYNGIAFKVNQVSVYIELNKGLNEIRIWIKKDGDLDILTYGQLEFYSRVSIPAWVLYQVSNI